MSESSKKTEVGKEILSWVLCIGIVIVLTLVIISFVGQRTKVIGSSMETTLQDGDNLIVEKLSYKFHDPRRFDIIVFPYFEPGEEHVIPLITIPFIEKNPHYIKRVIGLPGEVVQIVGPDIYINGEKLEEDFGAEPIQDAGLAREPITLGEDEFFVLGDNRNHSSDSRAWDVGLIKKSEITGRAWVRIFPFSKFGVLKHGE